MTFQRWSAFFAACFLGLSFAPAFGQQTDPPPSSPSLADVARRLRKDTTTEVRMTDSDTKKLFALVDKVFAFAAEDTGMPKRAVVKRQMVSKADVEKFATGRLAREEYTQRFAQAELSMKKLGFLPRDFNLRDFLVKSIGASVAGYYDEETKTISLLNWVPTDRQEPILAHELTHALQDQNYDLKKWMKAADSIGKDGSSKDSTNDDGATARKAVVEGQAMVVYVDYILAPVGRNLVDTPGLIYQMEEPAVKAVADSQMLHDAPMILREAGTFAYNEGLIFEGELLHKGGKKMAFAGVFARPPRNSHEVLQPETYINGEKIQPVHIPDMHQLLNNEYAVYDSGGIGELDVRALLKQYGERKIADELSSAWQGGAYVTYRRTKSEAASGLTPSVSDVALLYVSRWKSSQAAERFAHFYAGAVSLRYRTATPQVQATCTAAECPVSAVQVLTEEGPVIVEHWADNSVVVSESFDTTMAAKLRSAVREVGSATRAQNYRQDELGLGLYEIPAFQKFQAEIGKRIAQEIESSR
jgi:hypothetical protein